jgi:hypothetical protein
MATVVFIMILCILIVYKLTIYLVLKEERL